MSNSTQSKPTSRHINNQQISPALQHTSLKLCRARTCLQLQILTSMCNGLDLACLAVLIARSRIPKLIWWRHMHGSDRLQSTASSSPEPHGGRLWEQRWRRLTAVVVVIVSSPCDLWVGLCRTPMIYSILEHSRSSLISYIGRILPL